ncbi:MAG: hypothetical protein MHM6MM_007168 [Cercozoa sp. M6MM]
MADRDTDRLKAERRAAALHRRKSIPSAKKSGWAPNPDEIRGLILNNRYRIRKQINQGSFGLVYSARDQLTWEKVAVKLQPHHLNAANVAKESQIYGALCELQRSRNTNGTHRSEAAPRLHWTGDIRFQDMDYSVMVLDQLGDSLEERLESQQRRLSVGTVANIGINLVNLLETFHSINWLHRDIKPDNFLTDRGSGSRLYIIDFGLAKQYRKGPNDHAPRTEGHGLVGTARYCSINTHRGVAQSRRDDLEAVGYLLSYLLFGQLPWMGFPIADKMTKYRKIHEKKEQTQPHELFVHMPVEFVQYLKYVRQLKYAETPDYAFCRALLQRVVNALKPTDPLRQYRLLFDWQVAKVRRALANSQSKQQQKLADRESQQMPMLDTEDEATPPIEPSARSLRPRRHTRGAKLQQQPFRGDSTTASITGLPGSSSYPHQHGHLSSSLFTH